jgi:hypothetical protein
MQAALRPMNLGEILDRTFAIYRKKFLLFVGIAALPAAAMMLLSVANEVWWKIRPPEAAHLFRSLNVGALLYLLVFFHIRAVFQFLLYPSIMHLCSATLFGEPASLSLSLRAGLRRWTASIRLALLQIVIALIIPEVVCILLVGGAAALEEALNIDTSQWGNAFSPTLLLFILAGIAGYFWITSCVTLCWPASVCEALSVKQAIRRGRSLSKRRRRAIFLSQLLPSAIWWAFVFALGQFAPFVYNGLKAGGVSARIDFPVYVAFLLLGRGVVDILVGPIFPIIATLFYYDQRSRKEGFDVEKMMEAAGLMAPAAANVDAASGPVPGGADA